jgi:hypothetical protein
MKKVLEWLIRDEKNMVEALSEKNDPALFADLAIIREQIAAFSAGVHKANKDAALLSGGTAVFPAKCKENLHGSQSQQ